MNIKNKKRNTFQSNRKHYVDHTRTTRKRHRSFDQDHSKETSKRSENPPLYISRFSRCFSQITRCPRHCSTNFQISRFPSLPMRRSTLIVQHALGRRVNRRMTYRRVRHPERSEAGSFERADCWTKNITSLVTRGILVPITHRWIVLFPRVCRELASGCTTRFTQFDKKYHDETSAWHTTGTVKWRFLLTSRFCRATNVDWTRSSTKKLEPPPFVPRTIRESLLRFVDVVANRSRWRQAFPRE